LSNDETMLVADRLHYEYEPENKFVICEGDRATKLYLIIKGKCDVLKNGKEKYHSLRELFDPLLASPERIL
jgi:hypothetical protein